MILGYSGCRVINCCRRRALCTAKGVEIDDLFRNRWRTLLSIDDAIAGVHATIEELGMLDNTWVQQCSQQD